MGSFIPPETISEDSIVQSSSKILSRPDLPIRVLDDVIRIETLGLEWDLFFRVYEPEDHTRIPRDPDNRKAGIFLLHGGSADYRDVEPLALMLAKKFGFKVLSGSFPGRVNFLDDRHAWPGDTIHADGSVRTPIWLRGEHIGSDQYDIITDTSMRNRYGTRTLARARPGTRFHARMAAWPAAFEEGMIAGCHKHLPEHDYAIFGQGHSTGGPFICMLSQRISNMSGVVATEHSPFGSFCAARDAWRGVSGKLRGYEAPIDEVRERNDPFGDLYIRTWRDEARYLGPEALGAEGPAALMRLPSLMEDVFAEWDRVKDYPQFKAEYIVTQGITASLEAAARAVADRLALSSKETTELVGRFINYSSPLPADTARPVPPFLYSIARHSRDHSPDVYREVFLPAFAEIEPAPKVKLVQFEAGVHTFWKPTDELPLGIAPAVAALWYRAITEGYFASDS